MSRTILVTGGAGYIGSHTCLELLNAGFDVVVVDNLDNSSEESLRRVRELAGRELTFHKVDVCDRSALLEVFATRQFDAVIHFAGLKAVGESCEIPLRYYENNIFNTIELMKVMQEHECFNLVFSSSATVYGDPATVPITEDFPLSATNPYGRTKLFIEEIMRDVCAADDRWRCVLLRYFNPIGAHPSGRIGEDPQDIPNNLMPLHPRRHRRARLHPCGGSGPRSRGGHSEDGHLHRVCAHQSRHRPGLFGAGNGGGG